MLWKSLTDLFAREFRHLRRMQVISFGFCSAPVMDANELRREELELAPRIDAIVRDFARTRRWPALDEKERFFLRERIRFAYEYASIAELSVTAPINLVKRDQPRSEERRILEWYLIEIWRTSGVINWLEPFVLLTRAVAPQVAAWEFQVSE
jgi:hypothetical protein